MMNFDLEDQNYEHAEAEQKGAVIMGPGGKREYDLYRPAKLTSSQMRAVEKAKKYAMEQNIKSVLVKQTIVHQQQQLQKQQAMSMMSRSLEQVWTKLGTIYVGSINFDIREDTVKLAFLPFGPMKSIDLAFDYLANKHKGFAFIEYEIPEAAFLAIDQMNNVMLGGRSIKVGRPSNMPQAQPVIEQLMVEARKYNRIYVSSIHPDLTESDLQSVFEAFGRVISIKLAPDLMRPGRHRGYAFIEYDSSTAVDDAVVSMNLFDLGGQFIRVGRAVTPPNLPMMSMSSGPSTMPTASAVAAAAVTAKLTAMDAVFPTHPLAPPAIVVLPQLVTPTANLKQSSQSTAKSTNEHKTPRTNETARKPETRVMVLKNMVGPDDLDEELESEVTDECGKFGDVTKVVIYQERQSEDANAEIRVKIFVEFSKCSEMETAVKSLDGRFFDGRKVVASPYSQAAFDGNDLSG